MVTEALILMKVCLGLSQSAFRHKFMSQTDGLLDLELSTLIWLREALNKWTKTVLVTLGVSAK